MYTVPKLTTPQAVFDYVVRNLREQGFPSADPNLNVCAYRGSNGAKCAVGFLISDDEYTLDMEGESITDYWSFLDHDHPVHRFTPLVQELQHAHDGAYANIDTLRREANHNDTIDLTMDIDGIWNTDLVNDLHDIAARCDLDPAVIDEAPWIYKGERTALG